jgi:hypothetical protein
MPLSSISSHPNCFIGSAEKQDELEPLWVHTVCIRLKKYLRKILWQMESINSKSNIHGEVYLQFSVPGSSSPFHS